MLFSENAAAWWAKPQGNQSRSGKHGQSRAHHGRQDEHAESTARVHEQVTVQRRGLQGPRKRGIPGTSLAVQWLGLLTSPAGSMGSIPGGGTKIPHATLCDQKIKINKKEQK